MSSANGTSEWDRKDLPQFPGTKVYVLPGAFYGDVVALMAACGMERANTVDEADIVVFIGGADVDPKLYGQKCLAGTSFNRTRDDFEIQVHDEAFNKKKVMFGICRGAQFLHIMNGGELWQHVHGHGGRSHYIVDIEEDCRVEATSIHHQMLQDNESLIVVAVTEEQVSRHFEDDSLLVSLNENCTEMEVEAGAYLTSRCFFVQGHPEIGTREYQSWCMTKLHEFYFSWVGVEKSAERLLQIVNEQEVI